MSSGRLILDGDFGILDIIFGFLLLVRLEKPHEIVSPGGFLKSFLPVGRYFIAERREPFFAIFREDAQGLVSLQGRLVVLHAALRVRFPHPVDGHSIRNGIVITGQPMAVSP